MIGIDTSRRRVLRNLLAGMSGMLLGGCDALSRSEWFPKVLNVGERLSQSIQNTISPRRSMAQEFGEADLSPIFRSNGTSNPGDPTYQALAQNAFVDWHLQVEGLVERPMSFSLAQLRAMPARTQITRHDCVEGWSVIGKWSGVQLATIIAMAQPKTNARYVIFRSATRGALRRLSLRRSHGRCKHQVL